MSDKQENSLVPVADALFARVAAIIDGALRNIVRSPFPIANPVGSQLTLVEAQCPISNAAASQCQQVDANSSASDSAATPIWSLVGSQLGEFEAVGCKGSLFAQKGELQTGYPLIMLNPENTLQAYPAVRCRDAQTGGLILLRGASAVR